MPQPPIDLKKVLMVLGNRLVTERGFDPATVPSDKQNTCPVQCFTDWANKHLAVREILADMGFDWPLADPRRHQADLDEVWAILNQKGVGAGASVEKGTLRSGRKSEGILVPYRHGWMMFFIEKRSWFYEDYDTEMCYQGLTKTWLKDGALASSVADLVMRVINERGGHRV